MSLVLTSLRFLYALATITNYGQSCFSVNTGGKNILFDPFISGNPLAQHVDIDAVEADVILITHGHGDHIGDAVRIAKRTGALVVAILEVHDWLRKQGVDNVVAMNLGGTMNLGFAMAKMVRAVHSNSLPDGSYGGESCGFVVYNDEDCFYHAGDTALTLDMKLIADDFKLGFAMLPIGDHYTMGLRDAVRAAEFIRCDEIIGMHYDSFPPIEINKDEAIAEFENNGINLHLIDINETIEI